MSIVDYRLDRVDDPAEAPVAVSPAASLTKAQPKHRNLVGRVVHIITSLMLIAAAAGFLLLAVGPHVFGYRTATMLTGSMSPGINPGDVVVTVPTPVRDLAVGDIITYHIPVGDHRVETHRIIKVVNTDGRVSVVTKGDANNGADPWTASLNGDTVSKVKAVVPHLGNVIRVLRAPLAQQGVLWAALAGAVLLGMIRIWSRGEEDDDDVDD